MNNTNVPLWIPYVRIFITFITRSIFPSHVIDPKNVLAKVDQEAKKGKGLLIVYTHFGYRDGIEVNRSLILKSPVLRTREVINPISFHQYTKTLGNITRFLHGEIFPVVNDDTLQRKGYEHLPKGQGLPAFIARSSQVLLQGGVVTLAVNAGRRAYLDMEDIQKPVGYFIAATGAKQCTHYGVLLVSLSIDGVTDYDTKAIRGMNFGKTYLLTIGKYYDVTELLEQKEVQGKAGNVDAFVRKKLAEVVPKEYQHAPGK